MRTPSVMTISLEELQYEVLQKAFPKSTPESHGPLPTGDALVFVHSDAIDQTLVKEICGALDREQIGWVVPSETESPERVRHEFEDLLLGCDALMLIYGQSPGGWVRQQLMNCRKLQHKRETPLRALALFQGPPAYSRLAITDPRKHTILKVRPRGRLARQGLTQLSFESAEPKFDELDPPTFFRRFPEGPYDIRARSLEGNVLKATVALSHVLAAPVANITVSGVPAAASCDAVPLPSVSEPILIDWDPVTESHPEIGKSGPVEIVRYQFFVEREGVKLSVDLPPTVTQFEVPSDVTALGNEFKFGSSPEPPVATTRRSRTASRSSSSLR